MDLRLKQEPNQTCNFQTHFHQKIMLDKTYHKRAFLQVRLMFTAATSNQSRNKVTLLFQFNQEIMLYTTSDSRIALQLYCKANIMLGLLMKEYHSDRLIFSRIMMMQRKAFKGSIQFRHNLTQITSLIWKTFKDMRVMKFHLL